MAGNRKRKRNNKPARTAVPVVSAQTARNNGFPIVGVGASAGGLEAFTQLLRNLPADTGMAFVLVQHMDRKHESLLPELLSKATSMPVQQVKDRTPVAPNHIYVIPPNTDLIIQKNSLRFLPKTASSGHHMPIDQFLGSLAGDQKSRAIGIILSGTGSDGTEGIKAIKAEGGITYAQDEKSCKYPYMPRSALDSGCVDFVLPPDRIGRDLARIGKHPYVTQVEVKSAKGMPVNGGRLNEIILLLRNTQGVDFTHYKPATVKRRIQRRMALNKFDNLAPYLRLLQKSPAEAQALCQDILITVTSFFRDPDAFEALKKTVFPAILKFRASEDPIRVWVPGCATGEEAYSSAISLWEFLGSSAARTPIQIFGTDISETALEKARAGFYRDNVIAEVGAERLRRYFTRSEEGYQISKAIRDCCIFARQDVTKDPPFSKLDLISCRNVLIYMDAVLQKRIVSIFHYALKPHGFLWLGNSETGGTFQDLFTPADRKFRIFTRRAVPTRFELGAAGQIPAETAPPQKGQMIAKEVHHSDVRKEADRIVLNRYGPPGVIVDRHLDILQVRGRTGAYLEPAPGEANLNLLRMAREGLRLELRTAVHKALKSMTTVRKEKIRLRSNGQTRTVDIEVIPIRGPIGGTAAGNGCLLVLFQERPEPAAPQPARRQRAQPGAPQKQLLREETRRITQLRQELAASKEYLQSIIEEQETTNEELKSANEEILSRNEELQSINEEMETAKEELQSTNEELTTLNEEVQIRNSELRQLNTDLNNLLNWVNIPVVIVGRDLRIRCFTPEAERTFNLISGDVGRSIVDINPNLDLPEFKRILLDVIQTNHVVEREVMDKDGHSWTMRVRVHKNPKGHIEGAVIVMFDNDPLKRTIEALKESSTWNEAIIETMREPLLVLDPDLRVVRVNRSFFEFFRVSVPETSGKFIYDLGNRQWDIPRLRKLLTQVVVENKVFQNFEVEHDFPAIGRRTMLLNARPVIASMKMILLVIEDVTDAKRAEAELKDSEERYRALSGRLLQVQDEERRHIARELHDSTAQLLAGVAMNLAAVKESASRLDPKAQKALEESLPLAERASREVNVLAYLLHPPLLEEAGLAPALRWYVDGIAQRSGIRIDLELSDDLGSLPQDVGLALFRVVQESLTNVHRHSGGRAARIRIKKHKGKIALEVSDDGQGLPSRVLGKLQPEARVPPLGSEVPGIGIPGMRERIRQLGGRLEIESGDSGTTVRADLPLKPGK